METLKAVFDFVAKPEILGAVFAIIGGLKVVAKYTGTTIDDKVLGILEWPFKKLLGK